MLSLGFAVISVFRERFTEIMLRTQPAQQRRKGTESLICGNTTGPERIAAGRGNSFWPESPLRGGVLMSSSHRVPGVVIRRIIVMGIQDDDLANPFSMRIKQGEYAARQKRWASARCCGVISDRAETPPDGAAPHGKAVQLIIA